MSDAPERIWTGVCGKQIVQDGMNKWPSDIEYVRADLAEAAYEAGVRAGLEAAASSLEERGSDGWAEKVMAEYTAANAEAIRALKDKTS